MLMVIAQSPTFAIERFSRYHLYSVFIKRLHEREYEKRARQYLKPDVRLEFLRRLAWHFWTARTQINSFTVEEIPDAILDGLDTSLLPDSREAIKRDLIAGSFIELKDKNKYYFPHRSFHEFLVAEYITNVNWQGANLRQLAGAMNSEVYEFIREGQAEKFMDGMWRALPSYRGSLSRTFVEMLASSFKSDNDTGNRSDYSSNCWRLLVMFWNSISKGENIEFAQKSCLSCLRSGNKELSGFALYSLFLTIAAIPNSHINGAELIAVHVLSENLAFMKDQLGRVQRGTTIGIHADIPFKQMLLLKSFRLPKDYKQRQSFMIEIDFRKFNETLTAQGYNLIDDIPLEFPGLADGVFQITMDRLGGLEKRLRVSENASIVINFFKRFPDPGRLTNVVTQSRDKPRPTLKRRNHKPS